ncbi:MAG: winged helix-turn-helix transcriptional regulator [Acidimicrobiales bacterium]|jgi:DNA-binding HxlR family transcriptional regulator
MASPARQDEVARGARCDGLTAVFALLGKRWSGMIVGTLLSGPARFTEISRHVHGVSERMLSERLIELTAAGLVERTVLAGPPVGVEYRLTPRGEALRPALDELGRWATEHLNGDENGDGEPAHSSSQSAAC